LAEEEISMADLEDLIRQVNRDMEEHRWQVEASPPPRAMAEQHRLIAEQEDWLDRLDRYCRLPAVLAVAVVIGGIVGCGCGKVLVTVLGH
jgi:hypothetical protein